MNTRITVEWQRVPGLIDYVSDQYREWMVVNWGQYCTTVLSRGISTRANSCDVSRWPLPIDSRPTA